MFYRIIPLFIICTIGFSTAFAQTGGAQSARGNNTATDRGIIVDDIGLSNFASGLFMEEPIDPTKYEVGPFDAITISLRGPNPLIFRALAVNPMGDITIPTVGSIQVGGMLLSDVAQLIRTEVQKNYLSTDVHVTLEMARPQNVHLFGEVPNPGTYQLPAQTRADKVILNNIFGGIISSDGGDLADKIGVVSPLSITGNPFVNSNNIARVETDIKLREYSLRNVRIEHRDGTVTNADLVGFYMGGFKSNNPFLRDGDRVYVQKRRESMPRVAISGAVYNPFEAEYRSDDTIDRLIQMAGGTSRYAELEEVTVAYREGGSIRTVTVSKGQFESYNLPPNARIIVQESTNIYDTHSAWVNGEVKLRGNFPIIEGETTLYDLVQFAGGFRSDAMLNGAYIMRKNDKPYDQPIIFDSSDLMVRTADLSDEGVEYLALEEGTSKDMIYVDLRNEDVLKRIKIYDSDRLYVPRDKNEVMLIGQVNRTGPYPYNSSLGALEYIELAQGFSLSADRNRVFVIKAGSRSWYAYDQTTVESGDVIFVDRPPFEPIAQKRQADLESRRMRSQNIQLTLATITTAMTVITTYLFITRN
jgi:polysaccharide biosynthesis/export protein